MKTILVDALYAFVIDGRMFREMYDVLEAFPNRKILLTGASRNRFKEVGLDSVPYEVFTLENHPDKSDPEYYRKMLLHFHLKSRDVVYFEHNTKAIESARSVGIQTHYYDPIKKDLRSLKKFLRSTRN